MADSGGSMQKIKILAGGIVVLLSVGYLLATYSYWTSGGGDDQVAAAAPQRPGTRGGDGPRPGGDGPPNPGEMRQRFVQELGLTDEQQKQMEAVRTKLEAEGTRGPGAMMEAARDILTPEQQEKARTMFQQGMGRMQEMRARREQEARETLSPEDFKVWQQKDAERREEMRRRFQEGGFRGGPGGEFFPPPPDDAPRPADTRGGNST